MLYLPNALEVEAEVYFVQFEDVVVPSLFLFLQFKKEKRKKEKRVKKKSNKLLLIFSRGA
jgi:hypothetical protein